MGGLAFLTGHAASPLPERDTPVASSRAMDEAWTLADAAQGLAEAHQPAAALNRYRRAYDLSRDPSLLLEVARLERAVGNSALAAHAFEQFLEQVGDRAPESRKQLVTRQLQAAAATTARLNVQTNVVDAVAELEPQRGVATGSGFVVSVLLDAGERRLSLSKPGYETKSLVLSLQPGEVRTLRVDLDKAAAGRSDTSSGKLRFGSLERKSRNSDI
ncbi:MAG TPA: hypothetical protein VHB79_31925 [Polyangiaceae bacterium]|nr:hypothetical protein [Polyangiaceae bacterium]